VFVRVVFDDDSERDVDEFEADDDFDDDADTEKAMPIRTSRRKTKTAATTVEREMSVRVMLKDERRR
jgi:hypothetical protein